MVERIEQKVEALLADFGFRIKPIIFRDPQSSLNLRWRRYVKNEYRKSFRKG